MRLKYLTLKNFKGIKEFALHIDGGQDVDIYGDNATGKTTIFDAFTWLLFGKDSLGSAVFEIKSTDTEFDHGLEHTVAACITAEGSEAEIVLSKTYAEVWTKKRGSTKATFTGHRVSHFIDTVPVKQKDYNAAVDNICDEETFRILTNPRAFNEMLHWKERRALLLEVCGDISDGDVIDQFPALRELPKILGKRLLEDHRKVIRAKQHEINEEIKQIPVRIDEALLSKVDEADGEAEAAGIKLTTLSRMLRDDQDSLATALAAGPIAIVKSQLAEVEADLSRIDNARSDAESKHARDLEDERGRIADKISRLEEAVGILRMEAARAKKDIPDVRAMEEQLGELRVKWTAVKEEEAPLLADDDQRCPACGQDLPADQVTMAMDEHLANFNEVKAHRLKMIDEDGERLSKAMGYAKESIAIEAEAAKARESKIAQNLEDIENLKSQLADIDNQHLHIPDDPEREGLLSQKALLLSQLSANRGENAGSRCLR